MNCIDCRFCRLENAEEGYSEMTPGCGMCWYCSKNKWDFDEYKTTKADLANMLNKASSCPLFESETTNG